MAVIDDIYNSLDPFWRNFPDKMETVEWLWNAYALAAQDLEDQENLLYNNSSIQTLNTFHMSQFVTIVLDNEVTPSPDKDYPIAYRLPEEHSNIVSAPILIDGMPEITYAIKWLQDFRFQDGLLLLKNPPPGDRLFAPIAYRDIEAAYNNFGYLLGYQKESSLRYTREVQALWYVTWSDPSPFNMEVGLTVLLGAPFAFQAGTVKSIVGNIITVGEEEYEIPSGSKPIVFVGQPVDQFEPLTDYVRVLDPISDPYWWRKSDYHAPHFDSRTDTLDSSLNAISGQDSLDFDSYSSERVIRDARFRFHAFGVKVPLEVIQDREKMDLLRAFLKRMKPKHTFWIFDVDLEIIEDYNFDDITEEEHFIFESFEIDATLNLTDTMRRHRHWDNPSLTLDNINLGINAHFDLNDDEEIFLFNLFPGEVEFVDIMWKQQHFDNLNIGFDSGQFDIEDEIEVFETAETVGAEIEFIIFETPVNQSMDVPGEFMDDSDIMDLNWPDDGPTEYSLDMTLPPSNWTDF